MKRRSSICFALGVLGVVLFPFPSETLADTLTAQDLANLAQSTVTDTDALFLYLLGGNDPSASPVPETRFAYDATGNATGWSGVLSGTLVNAFTLNYVSTAQSATFNDWSSSGVLNAVGPVSGVGNAVVRYPTATTFTIAFADSLSAGGAQYSITSLISGTFNADGSVVFGPPSEVTSTNPIGFSGSGSPAYSGFLNWSYDRRYPNEVSDLSGVPIWPGGPWNNVYKTTPTGDGAYVLDGFILTSIPTIGASVPEPSTWAMMLLGFVSLGFAGYRRAREQRAA
jgi:PEP-CTERM motif